MTLVIILSMLYPKQYIIYNTTGIVHIEYPLKAVNTTVKADSIPNTRQWSDTPSHTQQSDHTLLIH